MIGCCLRLGVFTSLNQRYQKKSIKISDKILTSQLRTNNHFVGDLQKVIFINLKS